MIIEAALMREDSGEFASAIPTTSGVYTTERPPFLLADSDGRQGIGFRALPEWVHAGDSYPTRLSISEWPGWRKVEFNPQVALVRFLQVSDADSVLAFASRYGPLWACTKHDFPCLWRGIPHGVFGVTCDWVNGEPLDWWLGIARRMRAVVGSALRYKQGESLAPADWKGMGYLPPDAPYGRGEGLLVSAAVNGELQRYGVHLGLSWDLAMLEVSPGLGFVPALWQQLASALAGGRPIALCSGCATPYFREQRAPKKGYRNYCPACRSSHVAQRLSRQTMGRRH